MAWSTLLSLDCKKKLHRKHGFLQSTLITRIKAEIFWQWRCNDSIPGLSMWALCNMLAIISSVCSPMFCQLVNLSWINWKVQHCVREADCCWNNLYFKCSIHTFWPLYFQMASYKVQMLLAFIVQILCKARTWKDKYFPYHTSTEQIKIENSLGPFTIWRRGDSNVCIDWTSV